MRRALGGLLARRSTLAVCFSILLVAETGYFARELAASLCHIAGERSFFGNRLVRSWTIYRRALSLGGSRERIETDSAELLLSALDQWEAGTKIQLPLPAPDAIAAAHSLVARLLRREPYNAYYWSLASDVYLHAARQRRRQTPLDLATLSENPEANLLPEDWLGIAAMGVATRMEPHNYVYPDALVETLQEYGLVEKAARYCRIAVAANPVLGAHLYLQHPDLAPELLEGAVQGFEDARGRDSLVSAVAIDTDAGKLLAEHGLDQRALPYLLRAVEAAPAFPDAQFHLGLVRYRAKEYRQALIHLQRVAGLLPDSPWANYYMGLSYSELGMNDQAAAEFKEAKERDPKVIGFFHALCEALERQGKVEEARRQFVAAANLNQGDPSAWLSLLAFYVHHKDRKGSTEVCAKLSALGPAGDAARSQCDFLNEAGP